MNNLRYTEFLVNYSKRSFSTEKRRMRRWLWRESSLPFIGMVSAVAAMATNMIISKMAMSKGLSTYVLCFYSNGLATLILFPIVFLNHRSNLPPLSFPVIWRILVLAFLGGFAEIGNYAGIYYSSATLGTALMNLIPAFTYILSVLFSMEEVNWRRLSTISKSMGTTVCIMGAFIMTFYKGPNILNKQLTSVSPTKLYLSSQQNWILGGCLLAFASFFSSLWYIQQVSIMKIYPAEMIVVSLYCFLVTIQSLLVSLIAERDVAAWRIDKTIVLFAVLYAAIVNKAYRIYVTTWCLWRTDPLFVSLFKPLTVVIALVISVIFVREVLYLGSLVGALVLIIGFYAVMWGKAKERKANKGAEFSSQRVPLLQENIRV